MCQVHYTASQHYKKKFIISNTSLILLFVSLKLLDETYFLITFKIFIPFKLIKHSSKGCLHAQQLCNKVQRSLVEDCMVTYNLIFECPVKLIELNLIKNLVSLFEIMLLLKDIYAQLNRLFIYSESASTAKLIEPCLFFQLSV